MWDRPSSLTLPTVTIEGVSVHPQFCGNVGSMSWAVKVTHTPWMVEVVSKHDGSHSSMCHIGTLLSHPGCPGLVIGVAHGVDSIIGVHSGRLARPAWPNPEKVHPV
jgi:hypothetical protein